VTRIESFIEAAVWHGSLERADTMLTADPELAGSDIFTAAILGDAVAVRRFLAQDPVNATAKAGPFGGDALVYLCLSKYLRFDKARTPDFVRAATALLDAGADPNTGFWSKGDHPEFETALYGAAGVAHHAELTRLLLERGADPNDEETPYHAPETHDNTALKILVESGKLTRDSLAMILLRKTDWHDYAGITWLLEHGVDPNTTTRWGKTALHNAILSDNDLEIIDVLLDHGADPTLVASRPTRSSQPSSGHTAIAMAARRGRGDVLEAFERRGIHTELHGVERLLAACARNDGPGVRAMADREPEVVSELRADGARFLATFAGVGNTDGVRHLLDLGVDVGALFAEGDGYFDIAKDSLALHVAAWRANHATVRLLIEHRSPIDVPDGKGRTPLALAVRACVDSYWMGRRTPESVQALLEAGASVTGVAFPSGYAEVDALLKTFAS
jgi:ankyrin repeat protein